MKTDNKSNWLSWPVFYALSEVYQVPLNIIWFILSAAIAYQEFHIINLINVTLCCIDVMLFDIAVNIADNYFDYQHGKDPHFLNVTNPVGRLKLPIKKVRNLVVISYLVSAIPGIILVSRTNWQVLILGIIGYIVGIFYTAGKLPLNATPICEAIVSFFIAFYIVYVGVYVSVWPSATISTNEFFKIMAICTPLMLIFYAIQLANNTCDLEEDLINGRRTLASFTGKKRALLIIKALVIIGMILPFLLAMLRIIPIWTGLVSLWILPTLKHIRGFFENPIKSKTYLPFFKELAIFLIIYIFTYSFCVFLKL